MPIMFECVLRCDGPACNSQQKAMAKLEGANDWMALFGMGGGVRFEFQYETGSGLNWKLWDGGKVTCGDVCRDKLGLQGKPAPLAESKSPPENG